jgi:hypothetical protein
VTALKDDILRFPSAAKNDRTALAGLVDTAYADIRARLRK